MSEVNHADVMSRAEKMVEKFGVAQRGGKKYLEVKHRVALFRETNMSAFALSLPTRSTMLLPAVVPKKSAAPAWSTKAVLWKTARPAPLVVRLPALG